MAKVNHIYAAYLHLKIKIDKIFLNALNTQFLGKRRCQNDRFNDWTPISFNFESKEDADAYTDRLFLDVLNIDPEHSFNDADHHRWLKIETTDGNLVEIRPDHGISGGYKSESKYMNLDSLNGSVRVVRNNEDVLYYIIIKKSNA